MDDEFDPPEDERTAIVKLSELHGPRPTARDRHLLVRMQGSQVGQVVTIHGAEWRVGRARSAELWLSDSGVSRSHARFSWQGDGYSLEDLGSANGTYVNGDRVDRRDIKDGDIIQFGPGTVFRYAQTDADQEAMLQQLYDASVTDSLTGAYNREHFDVRLESELSFARRHSTELSLLMFDLDHFKRVNDTYGHQAGDAVLVQVAASIASSIRVEDVFARYGGEEFAAILRGIGLANAGQVGERFRAMVEALRIEHGGKLIPITVSVGVASLACAVEPTAESLIAVADRRLYAAKRSGRNRVVHAG